MNDLVDEEEQALLLEQARFNLQAGHSSAAASVVRCAQTAPESETVAANPSSSDSLSHAALQEGLLPIVGNIVERQRGSSGKQRTQREQINERIHQDRMGHPHRGDADVDEAGPRGFPRAEHRSKGSRFKSLGRKAVQDPASIPVVTSDTSADSDADAILGGMSAEEIEEAREELLARLPSKTVEFLRACNAKRDSGDALEASNGRGRDAAGRLDDGKMKTSVAVGGNDKGDGPQRPPPAVASEVERLRFDLSGDLLEIGPELREPGEYATLQRDLLRHRGEFYSVREACTLARSTDANQRVFSLRLLQSVLRRCRDGLFRCQKELVPSQFEIGPDVTWIQLWQHAVYVAQVAKTVRYALDDENPKVVGAACGALAGLVGVRVDDRDARYRHAPRCQVHHMQRAGTSAGTDTGPVYDTRSNKEWVSMPLDVGDRRQDALGAAGRPGMDEEEEADERDIARVDPVSGLLNMRLLHRLCFLLHSLRKDEAMVPMSAKGDVIDAVRSLSLAGGGVSLAISRTPRLLDALVANLPTYLDEPNGTASIILDTLANLVDSVADWSNGAIRLVVKYTSNAMLCHPRHPGIARLWRGLQVSGHVFTTLDDLYPKMCFGFDTEAFLSAACSCETGNASAASSLAVLNEAYGQLQSLDGESFYDADDTVHDRVAAMLVFAQCCFREFRVDGLHGTGDDMDSKEPNQHPGMDREERERISEIRLLVASCCCQAASLIIRPDARARVAACASWSAALVTAMTAFMNLACVVEDNTNIQERREMARLALAAVAADASLAPLDDPDILQPWDAPWLQRFVDMACLVDAIEMCTGELNMGANRRLLAVLPPGADRIGLRLLSHMFGESANDVIHLGMECIEGNRNDAGNDTYRDKPDSADNPDDLRVLVLSGMSGSIGYELQDAAGWTSLRSMQRCFAGRRSIMDGHGSVFPLQPGWEFAAARASMDVQRCRGTLAWILGAMELNRSPSNWATSMTVWQHAALFDALFGSSYRESPTDVAGSSTGDLVVQKLATELFARIMLEILSEGKTPPKEVWTMSRVREAAETLASDSFGDPFFGSCFSTLFCDRIVTSEFQEEILAILKDANALHYLPSIEEAPLGGDWILSSRQGDRSSAMDFEFLLGVVSSQAFAKALTTDSLTVDIIMIQLIRGADSDRKLDRVVSRLKKNGADTGRAQRYLSQLLPNPM